MNCEIPPIDNAAEQPMYVENDKNLVYTCKQSYANPSTTSKCTSGKPFPSADKAPLGCRPGCRVPIIDNASHITSNFLNNREFVEYTCNEGYSPSQSELQFQCIDSIINIAHAKCQS